MSKISPVYLQLGKIFEVLEDARFTADKDFGASPVQPYCWYLSPAAVKFLNKRNTPEWLFLKYNSQIDCKPEKWQGCADQGMLIRLILVGVPAYSA